MPVPHCFEYRSFVVCPEAAYFAVFQDCFGCFGPLSFYMGVRISLSVSAEEPAGILMAMAWHLQIDQRSIGHRLKAGSSEPPTPVGVFPCV